MKIANADKISYILILAAFITFFSLYWVLRSESFETFKNKTKRALNYIYPEQLKQICGNGTKPGNQSCVPDNDFVATQLIKQNFIREIDSEPVFTPDYAYKEDVTEVPKWFIHWTDEGAYSCERLIRDGVCNMSGNNCDAPCRCGDCAGWRGGNLTDCDNKGIGGGRVWCNLEPGKPFTFSGEPDSCECAYGYCAINGLCVSPYLMDGTKDNKRCCPECAFKSPDKVGGCSGGVKCDPNIQCEESVVELPGVQFKPDLSNPLVTLVNTVCSSKDSNDPNCYHPEHPNAMRTQAFIKVSPNTSNSFESLSPKETNTASGENEYECAMKCGNTSGVFDNDQTVNNQYECSKRCLPKLWRWYPVFEELSSGTGLKYTGGYYQSDELVRYLSSDIEIKICPDNTCETELNQSIDFTQFNNCTECEQCNYEYSPYKNNNGFKDIKYDCDKCKQCILNQVSENGINYQVACKNMVGCNTCENKIQEFKGVNFTECDTCLGADPNDETAGCKTYTLVPYEDTGSGIKYHKDAVIYNHGGDPFKEYTPNSNADAYDPASRDSGCDFGVISGAKTCDNLKGMSDGGFYRPYNCQTKC